MFQRYEKMREGKRGKLVINVCSENEYWFTALQSQIHVEWSQIHVERSQIHVERSQIHVEWSQIHVER